MLTESPPSTHLPAEVGVAIDRQPQLVEDEVETGTPVPKVMEVLIAVHRGGG